MPLDNQLDPSRDLTPVIEAILDAVPQLRDSYREHVCEQLGQSLPYVYLADAVRVLNEQLWARQLSMESIKRLCSTIENLLEKEDPDIDALIVLAFLEPLEGTMLFPIARSEFGPRTRKELLDSWGWLT
jgi:hypothetical protein